MLSKFKNATDSSIPKMKVYSKDMLSKFKNAINSNIPKMKVYSKNMLSKFKNVTDSSILKMRVYSKSALNTFKDTTTSCVSKMMIFSKDMLRTLCETDDATAVGSNTVPEKENDIGGKPQIERTAMTSITTARHKYSVQGKLPRQYLLLIQNNSWTLILDPPVLSFKTTGPKLLIFLLLLLLLLLLSHQISIIQLQ